MKNTLWAYPYVIFFLGGSQPAFLGVIVEGHGEFVVVILLLLLFLCLAFTRFDTPLPLSSQVRSFRPQEDLKCPN